ncbi:hypothetical protein [Butyrivibrio sp.]|uniref:hypothetical protein n=1 Tax=Butyrivibrio sp. TaxID=28121 RepID=UPI0025C3F58C|nr:hypothetical protein [Butyrivibrio sp.]MBQ7428348.1 hypothetical protein [Butyrivibrio sp.]MBQ9303652.1 hypothetical protein [Butyrivibrio sp.]
MENNNTGTLDGMIRLAAFPDAKENFEQKCYELYQLEWMMSHGYSIEDFFDQIKKSIISQVTDAECPYPIITQTQAENAMQCAYEEFDENGFSSGSLWVCINEFLDAEYRDAAYMKWLFETQVDTEADELKAMYRKFTGIDLNKSCDLKLHTSAGELKVYRNMDPNYKGIKVSLEPSGMDSELLVANIENAEGLNIGIQTYADAENDEPTTNEILCRESIEAASKAKVLLIKEELRKIVVDECSKYIRQNDNNKFITGDLIDEICFRCDSLETDDITQNIRACLQYAKENGTRALIKEMDDCNIWRYIG